MVCRSSGEPGGPRRCSGDTRAAYERAAQELTRLERARAPFTPDFREARARAEAEKLGWPDSAVEEAGKRARAQAEAEAEASPPAPGYVSCSNCADQFIIPGRTHGFSHCDQHGQWTPVPEEQQQWIRPEALQQRERQVIGRTPRPSGNAGVHAALRAAVLRMTDTDPDELDAEVAAAMAQVCKDCGDIGPGYCVCGLAAAGGSPKPSQSTVLVGVCFFCDGPTDGGAHLTRFGKICCDACWPQMKDVS